MKKKVLIILFILLFVTTANADNRTSYGVREIQDDFIRSEARDQEILQNINQGNRATTANLVQLYDELSIEWETLVRELTMFLFFALIGIQALFALLNMFFRYWKWLRAMKKNKLREDEYRQKREAYYAQLNEWAKEIDNFRSLQGQIIKDSNELTGAIKQSKKEVLEAKRKAIQSIQNYEKRKTRAGVISRILIKVGL